MSYDSMTRTTGVLWSLIMMLVYLDIHDHQKTLLTMENIARLTSLRRELMARKSDGG